MRRPCLIDLSANIEATPRERSDRGRCLLMSKKASSYRGAYRVPLLISLSVCPFVCQCVCVTFVVFTCFESCTRPISTYSGSMEAAECGLTRGTFRRAPPRGGRGRRAAVDFVVCFEWGGFFPFFLFVFFLRTHTA